MSLSVYINFPGSCREAIAHYARAFKSDEPKIMTFGDLPDGGGNLPETVKTLILNATVDVPGGTLMCSDVPPDRPVTIGSNVSVVVGLTDETALRHAFEVLREGGKVEMELQQTFWTRLYGYLTDKFGVCWMLNLNE